MNEIQNNNLIQAEQNSDMKPKNPRDYISKIIEHLDHKQMSAFIGAGFSKNANAKFPSWDELLENMILELYEDEYISYIPIKTDNFIEKIMKQKKNREKLNEYIKNENIEEFDIINSNVENFNFEIYRNSQNYTSIKKIILQLFEDEYSYYRKIIFIEEKIKKIGYLEIVDKYITYKGMRESVDIYIEEYFNNIDFKPSHNLLDIHKKLLKLPWNNIYTTNYDELLEEANKYMEKDFEYNTIKEAKELSLGTTKRIIKLHGSLRKDKEEYGFDGDRSRHYIISKNDYKEYPEKHSAFTHLMRIALLQEKFCLIGFSGNDPNFLNWVDWVRDILKNEKDEKVYLLSVEKDPLPKDRELFFSNYGIINIPLKEVYGDIDRDELIDRFLSELHKALDTSSRTENNEPLKKNDSSENEKETHGFQSENNFESPQPSINIITPFSESNNKKIERFSNPKNEIENIFINLSAHKIHFVSNFHTDVSFSEKIQKLKNRKNDFYIVPPRILALSEEIISVFATTLYNKFENKENEATKIEILDILSTLIHYTNYTLDCFYSSEKISNFENFVIEYEISQNDLENQIINNFYLLLAKSYRSQNKIDKFMEFKQKINTINDKFIEMEFLYEEILINLINFKPDDAKKLLEKFDVAEYPWLRVKKAFVSLNLGINSEEILKLFKEPIKEIGIQDETLIMDLSNRYDFGLNFERNLDYMEKVRTYKGLGYFDINNLIDYYMKTEETVKILPFNEKRYKTENKTSSKRKNVDIFYKNKALYELFIKIGFPLRIKNYMNFPEKDFTSLLDLEYQFDLNFIVFLILQYGGNDFDEKFVITCIQKIINRDDIVLKDKRALLINMWKTFNTQLKTGIYEKKLFFIISELTEISRYEEWKELFSETWELSKSNNEFKNSLFLDFWGLIKPFSKILKYVSNENIVNEILEISYFIDDVNTMFNLTEDILRYMVDFTLNDDSIIVNDIIDSIDSKTITEDELIKIYSLKKCLSNKVLEKIKDSLLTIGSFKNLNLPFSFFPEDNEILSMLKNSILTKNRYVFYTDIDETNRRQNQSYISFSSILLNNQISWEIEELKKIYNIAKDSILKIEKYDLENERDDFFYSIYLSIDINILKDIELFLMFYKSDLENLNDYQEIVIANQKLLFKLFDFTSLEEALIDSDEDTRYKASNYYFGIIRHIHSYHNPIIWKIIISKIMDFSDNRAEVALEGLSNYLLYFLKNEEWPKKYIDDYVAILSRLKYSFDKRFERKLIKRCAVKLAFALKNHYNINNEIVNYWLDYKEKSEYNEIVSISLLY